MEKNSEKYDLDDRTFEFAKSYRAMFYKLPEHLINREDGRQLVKSSGSVGANYIEANESLSKKDFNYRKKVSRKEAKESLYWLRLLHSFELNQSQKEVVIVHGKEADILRKILFSNLEKY